MYDSLCKEFSSITLYTISSKLYSGSCYSWLILRIFIHVIFFLSLLGYRFLFITLGRWLQWKIKINLLEISCENSNNMVNFGHNLSSKSTNKLGNMSSLLRNTIDVKVCCRCSCVLSMFIFAVNVFNNVVM